MLDLLEQHRVAFVGRFTADDFELRLFDALDDRGNVIPVGMLARIGPAGKTSGIAHRTIGGNTTKHPTKMRRNPVGQPVLQFGSHRKINGRSLPNESAALENEPKSTIARMFCPSKRPHPRACTADAPPKSSDNSCPHGPLQRAISRYVSQLADLAKFALSSPLKLFKHHVYWAIQVDSID